MLLLGILGLTANIASVWVLSGGRDHNLNMRAAFLEVVNDAFGPIAVIASALVIQYTGWTQADALAGMLISILIVPRALRILRQAGSVLLETVPEGLHLDDVCTFQLEPASHTSTKTTPTPEAKDCEDASAVFDFETRVNTDPT